MNCRKAFEYNFHPINVERDGDSYIDSETRAQWWAWKTGWRKGRAELRKQERRKQK